jgi:hypothetical protein
VGCGLFDDFLLKTLDKSDYVALFGLGHPEFCEGRGRMTEEPVPVALADAHAPVGEHHVPAAIVGRSARARAEEVDQELLLALDAVLPAMCPETAELQIGPEPWQQIVRYRRDRVVTTKTLVKSLLLVAHCVLLKCGDIGAEAFYHRRASLERVRLLNPDRITTADCAAAHYGSIYPDVDWLCWAAVRRIPGSLERSRCARVVITQRPQPATNIVRSLERTIHRLRQHR